MAKTWHITLDGQSYNITHSELLTDHLGQWSLHLSYGREIIKNLCGTYQHLRELFDQCKAVGIPCERNSVD